MRKDDFKYLQALIIAQSTLLGALIQDMSHKGLIDGDKVMAEYDGNLKSMVNDLTKQITIR